MAITLPIGIRIAAGLLGSTIDRIGRLPAELPTLGVSLAGQAVRTSFRIRQELAELATRGDELLAGITGRPEEKPAWATFDEDEDDAQTGEPATGRPIHPTAPASPTAPARATRPAPTSAPTATAAPTPTTTAAPTPAGPGRPGATAKRPGGTSPNPTPARPAGTRASVRSIKVPTSATTPATTPATVPVPSNRIRPSRTQAPAAAAATGSPIPVTGGHVLSVAELKEELQDMEIEAVRQLLSLEETGPNRAAYLTLLTNRLTTLAHEIEQTQSR